MTAVVVGQRSWQAVMADGDGRLLSGRPMSRVRFVGIMRHAEGRLPPGRAVCDTVEKTIDLLHHHSAMVVVLTVLLRANG